MKIRTRVNGRNLAIAVPKKAGYGPRGRDIARRDDTVRSHAEFERVLRRAGYPDEFIGEVLGQLPDPVDLRRDQQILGRYRLSSERLMDRLGASP